MTGQSVQQITASLQASIRAGDVSFTPGAGLVIGFVGVAVGLIAGYAAASGKLNPFPKADAGCVSYVRRLAEKHIFRCPVFGHDIAAMVRQAQMALAQAYTRLGKHAETVQLFEHGGFPAGQQLRTELVLPADLRLTGGAGQ